MFPKIIRYITSEERAIDHRRGDWGCTAAQSDSIAHLNLQTAAPVVIGLFISPDLITIKRKNGAKSSTIDIDHAWVYVRRALGDGTHQVIIWDPNYLIQLYCNDLLPLKPDSHVLLAEWPTRHQQALLEALRAGSGTHHDAILYAGAGNEYESLRTGRCLEKCRQFIARVQSEVSRTGTLDLQALEYAVPVV